MDGESKTDADEVCCVCAEFGRDNELWYKCSNARCKNWTHKDCSGWENKSVAYLCDVCAKKIDAGDAFKTVNNSLYLKCSVHKILG